MISQHSKKGLHNPWFLGMLGMIILVLAVNGMFIWFAMHSRPALVDRDYSVKDRKSNAAVADNLREQKALAWRVAVNKPGHILMGLPVKYEISVVDREGIPVSGSMEVEAYRASDAGKDFTTVFAEVSPGNYRGYINLPLKGYWELRIRVKRGADTFEAGTDRFMVSVAP